MLRELGAQGSAGAEVMHAEGWEARQVRLRADHDADCQARMAQSWAAMEAENLLMDIMERIMGNFIVRAEDTSKTAEFDKEQDAIDAAADCAEIYGAAGVYRGDELRAAFEWRVFAVVRLELNEVTIPAFNARTDVSTFAYSHAEPGWHGLYVKLWREGLRLTAMGQKVRLERFGRELDAAAFRAEMRLALDKRINAKGPERMGRKLDPDYQRGLLQDSYDVRKMAQRVRIYQLRTPELRTRFAHLLSRHDD